MTRNGDADSSETLMHVDTTVPLWAFFNLVGSITAIEMVGTLPVTPTQSVSQPAPVFAAAQVCKETLEISVLQEVTCMLFLNLNFFFKPSCRLVIHRRRQQQQQRL